MRPRALAKAVAILSFATFATGYRALGEVVGNPEINLVDVAPGHNPRIAVDKENRIHAVFEGLESGSQLPEIFYSRSVDGGKTWSPPKDISGHTPGASLHPDIAVEPGGAVDVIWSDTAPGRPTPTFFLFVLPTVV